MSQMHMKYLLMKNNAKNTTSSGWSPNRVVLITVKEHSKEVRVPQDMRERRKMLKMTISMAASRAKKTFTTFSQALLNSKKRRRESNRGTGIGLKARMTFSEPLNILDTKIKKQRIKTLTLGMKSLTNGLNRNNSHKVIIAVIMHLTTMRNGATQLIHQNTLNKILTEGDNMKKICGSKLSVGSMKSRIGTLSRIIDTRSRQMLSVGPSEKRSLASIIPEKTLALMKRIEHIIRSKEVVTSHTSLKAKTCSKSIETTRQRNSMALIKI